VYLLEEQLCQISSQFDLKRQSFGLFWTASAQQEEQQDEQRHEQLVAQKGHDQWNPEV